MSGGEGRGSGDRGDDPDKTPWITVDKKKKRSGGGNNPGGGEPSGGGGFNRGGVGPYGRGGRSGGGHPYHGGGFSPSRGQGGGDRGAGSGYQQSPRGQPRPGYEPRPYAPTPPRKVIASREAASPSSSGPVGKHCFPIYLRAL